MCSRVANQLDELVLCWLATSIGTKTTFFVLIQKNGRFGHTLTFVFTCSRRRYQWRTDKDVGRSSCQHEPETGGNTRKIPSKVSSNVSFLEWELIYECFYCVFILFRSIYLKNEPLFFPFPWQNDPQMMYYKNLNREELWLDCAEKLTNIIQNIIEFAKLIPGFMRLSQDDQVRDLRQLFHGLS